MIGISACLGKGDIDNKMKTSISVKGIDKVTANGNFKLTLEILMGFFILTSNTSDLL